MAFERSPLLTDLYQFNMLQAYHDEGLDGTAVFEFFIRKLPEGRHFFLAAGLQQAVEFLEDLAFTAEDLDGLARSGRFSPAFLERLAGFRFTGDVDAMPEGTVFFADEPILRVTAPLSQAQFVETRIINILHYQTLVASKAARMVHAAGGRMLIDFGLRRAHSAEAGLYAARAAYLAGFAGSATVLAESLFGVPAYGTMAHSYILAHASEEAAFEAFARARPERLVLLLDTYDTEAAAAKVVALAPRLAAEAGIAVRAVRLDSGDLGAHAWRVRRILDDGGLDKVGIFASGGLDEHRIAALDAAPIEGFGVGTALVVSDDVPALDCAYKLQEYDGKPRRKRSEGKATWPGRKQVLRCYQPDGHTVEDVLTLDGAEGGGEPLLRPVMRAGRRVAPLPTLVEARAHAHREQARLPDRLRGLGPAEPYPVQVAPVLRELAERVDREAG